MIWIIIAMMAACTVLGLIWPMGGPKEDADGRSAKAMAIYEDQLGEVDRDAARGLITPEEARAAQVEIKRRMLAVDSSTDRQISVSGKLAVIIAALFVPAAGFGLYLQVGSPDVTSIPFADRVQEQQDAAEVQTLIAELRSRLQSDPNGGDLRGWELLGATLMNRGRIAEAVDAFQSASALPDATSGTWSQYAESLIAAENGVVTPLASRAIARAEELDPSNPAATFYRAVELEQSGQSAEARQRLLDRIATEGAPAPWMPAFLQTANEMGARLGLEPATLPEFGEARGPSQEDIAAAAEMTPEERQEFIRSMVDGLEARLQDAPGDLDGWLQLARALLVMGEQDRAVEALRSAEALITDLPPQDQRRRLVEEGLKRFAAE